MEKFISIIIPNYQGVTTIAKCLEAAFASNYQNFEVIVIDDCSEDNSTEVIKKFPCKLIKLESHSGAAQARNIGATQSKGDILFFTDSDCLLQQDSLSFANKSFAIAKPNVVIGGTYTRIPFDNNFFSWFQSVFINYSETRELLHPDYIATHAMVIETQSFHNSGGFTEKFLPILEDVNFSHRLRQCGYRLIMNPNIQVQHIFNFSLFGSLRNAIRKSMYWTIYSINYGDVLVDSGTASISLKINVLVCFLVALLLLAYLFTANNVIIVSVQLIMAFNLFMSRGLIKAFYRAKGFNFAFAATCYYLFLYPIAVGFGALAGIARYIPTKRSLRENS